MQNSTGRYRYPTLKSVSLVRKYNDFNKSKVTSQGALTITVPSTHGAYKELLFDERWRLKRKIILQRDRNKCFICRKTEDLQVHHRQYHFILKTKQFKPPWDYDDHLLITLCKSCHNKGHNKYKVPTLSF